MKDKIYKFIGETTYIIAKFTLLAVAMIIISTLVFEKQKAEIWMEAVESFSMLYDAKVMELHDRLGIVDQDQKWGYDTYNISLAPEKQTSDVPDLLEEASAVCIDKLIEARQVIGPEQLLEIQLCVQEQLQSAKIVLYEYMFYIEGLANDDPSKVILQKVVVNCNNSNTTTEGFVDHTNMLECLRSEVRRLNEMLDRELNKLKREQGI